MSQRSLRLAQRQAPFSQRREQQSASLLQKSPLSPQSQLPLRQMPEQHPRSRRQRAPWPAHWQLPLLLRRLRWHLREQQSLSARHLAPLTLHSASRRMSLSCAMPSSARARVRSAAAPPARPLTAVLRSLVPATIRVQLSKRQSSTRPSLRQIQRVRLRGRSNPSILRQNTGTAELQILPT